MWLTFWIGVLAGIGLCALLEPVPIDQTWAADRQSRENRLAFWDRVR